jgi:hypothetical protein
MPQPFIGLPLREGGTIRPSAGSGTRSLEPLQPSMLRALPSGRAVYAGRNANREDL